MDQKTREAVEYARLVARNAQAVRTQFRRRTEPGSATRETALADQLDHLHKAMAPIRQQIGRIPYARISERDERILRETSKALKYERKQIRKMQRS